MIYTTVYDYTIDFLLTNRSCIYTTVYNYIIDFLHEQSAI